MKIKANDLQEGMRVSFLTWVAGVRQTKSGDVYARYRTLGLFESVKRHRSSHMVEVKI